MKQLESNFIVVLLVLRGKQTTPIHLVDLERHEDILSQHLLNIICSSLVIFRHDKAHQVLIQFLTQVDVLILFLPDQFDHIKPGFQDRYFDLCFSWGVLLFVFTQKAIE